LLDYTNCGQQQTSNSTPPLREVDLFLCDLVLMVATGAVTMMPGPGDAKAGQDNDDRQGDERDFQHGAFLRFVLSTVRSLAWIPLDRAAGR